MVLSSNQYLKLGLEALIAQRNQSDNEQIIIFNVDERIYFLQQACKHEYHQDDLFIFLLNSECFLKREVETEEFFFRRLDDGIYRMKNQSKRSYNEISKQEALVLNALCNGWPNYKIANLLNKSTKTISTQKNSALRKLGMRNMQILHRTMIQWNILTKE